MNNANLPPLFFVISSLFGTDSLIYPSLPLSDFHRLCFDMYLSDILLFAAVYVDAPPELKLCSFSFKFDATEFDIFLKVSLIPEYDRDLGPIVL